MMTRALHYVFKIPSRNVAVNFYKNILGMKVLRHEEFQEGCKASCNGLVCCFEYRKKIICQALRRQVEQNNDWLRLRK